MLQLKSESHGFIIDAPFGAVGFNIQNNNLHGIVLLPFGQPACAFPGDCAELVAGQVKQYLADPNFKIEASYVTSGTPFQQRVWKEIAQIPVGEVRTYADLANTLGSGPRAVANACGANRFPLLIPCHRVVAKNGLGGFIQGKEGGLKIKEWLLAHESK